MRVFDFQYKNTIVLHFIIFININFQYIKLHMERNKKPTEFELTSTGIETLSTALIPPRFKDSKLKEGYKEGFRDAINYMLFNYNKK